MQVLQCSAVGLPPPLALAVEARTASGPRPPPTQPRASLSGTIVLKWQSNNAYGGKNKVPKGYAFLFVMKY